MRFVNLATVYNSHEAHFIKEDLAEEGIACIVTNENITALMPHMNGLMGSGVQVLVDKDELDAARAILDRRSKKNIVVCPNCGSDNIHFGLGTKHSLKRILAIFISLLFILPIGHVRPTHYCNACKCEF